MMSAAWNIGEGRNDEPMLNSRVELLRMLVIVVVGGILLLVRRWGSLNGVGSVAVVVVIWSSHGCCKVSYLDSVFKLKRSVEGTK